MNYQDKYLFRFFSDSGHEYEIAILKKGYSGESYVRPLGGSPLLRRDRSENICGTSMEFPAECVIDGEYAELFTPDPTMYKVELRNSGTVLWRGFVCPELYSEPDIAPPYDVTVTAVDGLGELKRHTYEGRGLDSLYNILVSMLSKTGIDFPIRLINSINVDAPEHLPASEILSLRTNLDYLAGESCYDVLQIILSTFNARISQVNDCWLIWRDNDVEVSGTNVIVTDAESQSQINFGARLIGSKASTEWWPIGQLANEISPAYRKQLVTAENKYKPSAFLNSDMSEDAKWEKDGSASYDTNELAYKLSSKNDSIFQTIGFEKSISYRLLLRIKARNYGQGDEVQNLGIEVTMNGRTSAGSQKYYLVQSVTDSNRSIASYVWRSEGGVIELELETPAESDTADDAQDIEIVLPLYAKDSRSYAYADDVTVRIFNPSGTYSQYIYFAQLLKYDQAAGYQNILQLGNGAREDASEVNVAFGKANLSGQECFMYAVPLLPSEEKALKWSDKRIGSLEYLELISRDYARSIALPRLIKRGRLNVPENKLPLVFFDKDNTEYWINTYSWDLLTSEVEVELLSLPIAFVEVESEILTEITPDGLSSSVSAGTNAPGESKITTLDALSDVTLTDEVADSFLIFDGKEWVNMTMIQYLSRIKSIGDWFYMTEDGAIGTKYDFFSEKQLSAKGLNTAGGSGGGLITRVYGAADLGGIIPENNTATFNAYAINSIYLRLAQLENNGGGGFDINQLENYLTTNKYVTQDWVSQQEFLDSAGGTIKGNLRLKADGSNFGNYLYFGDGSYCYIQEDKDDHLKIFADNGIAFVTDADKTATLNGENILTASALNGYATESWVKNQAYLTASALNGYATESWVEDKKYITAASLNGYATESWVIGKGYITAAALEFYATQSWVQNRGYITADYLSGYASEQWVTERGYITATALKGYATESWVEAFGFVTAYQLSGMGFLTGITSKMVTDALGYYPFNSSGFSKANIQTTLGISDWALASTKPSYSFNEVGLGTGNISLNGSSSTFATVSGEVSDKTFYAPVTAGAKGTLLVGNGTGSAPTWATKSSIGLSEFDNDEGFLTSEDMADYATMEWVNGRGFLTSSSLSGYATQSWVEGKGYLTNGSLSGYATQSWVNQQGFITSLYLDAYPSKTWVEQNFLSLLGGTIEGDLFISDYLSIGSTSQTEQVTLSDSMQVGGYVSFGTVGANLGSTNPVSTFRQTIFGNTTNRSRIRTFRATSDISGFASAYAAGFAWAAGDTHAYIAVSPYKNSGMNSIWIGAGDAGVIDWVCNVFHNQANLIPGSNGSYTLGSSSYGWLAGYFHRSANGDVISINDSRTSQGYQAIRFNRDGTDYAAMQWFHDGFNSSSYWWNSKSCLNFDTNAGGTITFGTWSSPLFIIDNTNRRNVIPAGIPLVFLDSSGNAHSLSYDSSKSAFKFDGNVYSTQEIAAKGMSASDGMARIASLESTIASQASEITALKKRVTALE